MRHFLYRHFSASGRLLYVGISHHPIVRTDSHRSGSPWFDGITRIELQKYPSRATAARAELAAIRNENPLYNRSTVRRRPLKLADYLRTLTPLERKNFALRVPTTEGHLYQLAGGHCGPSLNMARAIQRASKGEVTLNDWEKQHD